MTFSQTMNIFVVSIFIISLHVCNVLSSEFCNDTNDIRIFFISNNNYIIKGSGLYRSPKDRSFKDTDVMTLKVYFKTDFQRIFTGFAITRTPKCEDSSDYCRNLKKISNMSFVIGDISEFFGQSYVSYRIDSIGSRMAVQLITNSNEMPFNMKPKSEITQPFWPFKPDTDKYLHSAYVEREYRLILLVLRKGEELLYTTSLSDPNWQSNWILVDTKLNVNPNDTLGHILGFFHWSDSVYALTKLDNSDEPSILRYEKNGKFVLEPNLVPEFDLYGCKDRPKTTTESQLTNGTNGVKTSATEPKLWLNETTVTSVTPPQNSSNNTMILIIIILFAFILIVVIVLVIVFIVKRKNVNKNEKEVNST